MLTDDTTSEYIQRDMVAPVSIRVLPNVEKENCVSNKWDITLKTKKWIKEPQREWEKFFGSLLSSCATVIHFKK